MFADQCLSVGTLAVSKRLVRAVTTTLASRNNSFKEQIRLEVSLLLMCNEPSYRVVLNSPCRDFAMVLIYLIDAQMTRDGEE